MSEEISWKAFVIPLIVLIVFLGAIIGVVNWQKSKTSKVPTLSVSLPDEVIETAQEEVTIDGETDEKNRVWINDESVEIDKDGKFSVVRNLAYGENIFIIKAENKSGKSVSITRTIVRSGVEITATTTQPITITTISQVSMAGPDQNLANSGPEEYLIPTAGLAGMIWSVRYWILSRRKLKKSYIK